MRVHGSSVLGASQHPASQVNSTHSP